MKAFHVVHAGSKNFNILAFAGLFAIATTVGGVLLTDAVDLGEVGFKQGASSASAQLQQLTSTPDEGNSRLLLEIVAGLFGVTATGVGMFCMAQCVNHIFSCFVRSRAPCTSNMSRSLLHVPKSPANAEQEDPSHSIIVLSPHVYLI